MSTDPFRVLSLVMSTFGRFRQLPQDVEKHAPTRFQGGSAEMDAAGRTQRGCCSTHH